MTALSASRITKSRGITRKTSYLMAVSTTIYEGGMITINASGLAIPAAAGSGFSQVVGVAATSVTSAGSGSYYIEVLEGEFLFGADAITQAHVGSQMFANDDQTFDNTQGTNEPGCGMLIEFVSTTSGWIRVGPESAIA